MLKVSGDWLEKNAAGLARVSDEMESCEAKLQSIELLLNDMNLPQLRPILDNLSVMRRRCTSIGSRADFLGKRVRRVAGMFEETERELVKMEITGGSIRERGNEYGPKPGLGRIPIVPPHRPLPFVRPHPGIPGFIYPRIYPLRWVSPGCYIQRKPILYIFKKTVLKFICTFIYTIPVLPARISAPSWLEKLC